MGTDKIRLCPPDRPIQELSIATALTSRIPPFGFIFALSPPISSGSRIVVGLGLIVGSIMIDGSLGAFINGPAARAVAGVRYLTEKLGVEEGRISAAGSAQSRPQRPPRREPRIGGSSSSSTAKRMKNPVRLASSGWTQKVASSGWA